MSESVDELEQQWKASGTDADEASYLRACVRAGRLPQVMLQLAAHLGHPAARMVFGGSAPPESADLGKWVAGFDRYGKEALVRAAIAAARYPLPLWELKRPNDRLPQSALDAAEGWVLNQDEAHVSAAEKAGESVANADRSGDGEADDAQQLAGQTFDADMGVHIAADMAAEAAHLAGDMGEAEDVAQAVQTAEVILGISRKGAAGELLKGTIRDAICSELVPWALGYGDPIRERQTS